MTIFLYYIYGGRLERVYTTVVTLHFTTGIRTAYAGMTAKLGRDNALALSFFNR